jgi:hypothetical protein
MPDACFAEWAKQGKKQNNFVWIHLMRCECKFDDSRQSSRAAIVHGTLFQLLLLNTLAHQCNDRVIR